MVFVYVVFDVLEFVFCDEFVVIGVCMVVFMCDELVEFLVYWIWG